MNKGTDAEGRPFYIESEDLVVGDTLYHTDRVYNQTTGRLDETRYTLDRKDPKAKPMYINDNVEQAPPSAPNA